MPYSCSDFTDEVLRALGIGDEQDRSESDRIAFFTGYAVGKIKAMQQALDRARTAIGDNLRGCPDPRFDRDTLAAIDAAIGPETD